MQVRFHRNFYKRYKIAPKQIQKRADERVVLFTEDPFNPILNNHPLQGELQQYRSINITGNWRMMYKLLAPDLAIFIMLGTHSELYE